MKKFFALCMSVLMTLSLAACGSNTTPSATPADPGQSSAPSGEHIVLKLGHVANLEQPYHIAAEQFAADVLEATDGRIEIQVFPNSQLGGQRDLLEGLQVGTCDIAFTSSATLSNFLPKAAVIDFPFLFRDKQHVYDVVDGPLADQIYAGAEDIGMKVISTWENGFRNIMNAKHAVRSVDDCKNLKLRVFESDIYIDMFEALGVLPTPMAMSEVFTAVQQGTVDGLENAVVQIYASKYQEVCKYLTITEHTYNPQCFIISLNVWEKLSAEDQQIIQELADKNRDYNRQLAADLYDEYLQGMKDEGVEVVELTESEKQAFKDVMMPVWEKYYDVVGKDLVDAILNT